MQTDREIARFESNSISPSPLRRHTVALLEFLAAAAGTRIIAANAGIGIRDECRLGDPRLPALDRRWRWLTARDKTIGRRF